MIIKDKKKKTVNRKVTKNVEKGFWVTEDLRSPKFYVSLTC